MIYFDNKHIKVLKHIARHKNGVSIEKLERKFGDTANISFLINLSKEHYVLFGNADQWIEVDYSMTIPNTTVVFATSKSNEFIEKRCYEFWRWSIPTIISVAALIVSVITLLSEQGLLSPK